MAMKRTTTPYVAMDPHRCVACWKCVDKCPKQVIGKTGCFLWHRHVTLKDADACVGCGRCVKVCPNGVFFRPDKAVPVRKQDTGFLFRMERLLPVAFLASAVTGIGLHIAGHGLSHETWHYWGAAHIVSSVLWLLSVTAHAVRHRYWYQALIPERFTNRWRITFALSMLFMVVVVTGIGLLACVEGPNSSTGLWHYKLGLLLSALSLIHVFYRK